MEVIAHRVEHWKDLKNPGDFILTTLYGDDEHRPAGIVFVCPCGCGEQGALAFDVPFRKEREKAMWLWDMNEDKPTLIPSILKTTGCAWHGFLSAGIFKQC